MKQRAILKYRIPPPTCSDAKWYPLFNIFPLKQVKR